MGSGTGFLTAQLLSQYPGTVVHAVDMAQGMLNQLALKIPNTDQLQLHLLDGEQLERAHFRLAPKSLLVSGMCAQWFNELGATLERWLSISDTVAFSILLDGSFQAWVAAHRATGQNCGLRKLPSTAQLEQELAKLHAQGLYSRVVHHRKDFLDHHTDGLSFARSLRAIGADLPKANHKPASLRRVIEHLGEGCTINYNIGFYLLQRS